MDRICDFDGERLRLKVEGGKLCSCLWTRETDEGSPAVSVDSATNHRECQQSVIDENSIVMAETERQLREYFAGERRAFNLPVSQDGTDFQKKVWNELLKLPYGVTISYGELARRIGNPKAVRAVARACGANKVVIVVPCHRIIATGGKTGGYTGGVQHKIRLLEIEAF